MVVFWLWSLIELLSLGVDVRAISFLEYYVLPSIFIAFLCFFVYLFARIDKNIFLNIEVSEKTIITLVSITTYWIFSLRLNENFPELSNLIFRSIIVIFGITFLILIYVIHKTLSEYVPRIRSGIIVIPLGLVDVLFGFILSMTLYGFAMVNLYYGYPGSYKFMEVASILTFAYYGNSYLKELTTGSGGVEVIG